jgi:hypothetical protein
MRPFIEPPYSLEKKVRFKLEYGNCIWHNIDLISLDVFSGEKALFSNVVKFSNDISVMVKGRAILSANFIKCADIRNRAEKQAALSANRKPCLITTPKLLSGTRRTSVSRQLVQVVDGWTAFMDMFDEPAVKDYIRQLSASERNKLMDLRKAFEDKNMQIFVKEASRVASTISMAQRSVERDGTNLSDAVEAYKWMLDTVATV